MCGFHLLHEAQVQLLKSDEPFLNITRITKVNLVLEKEEDDQPQVLRGFYAVCKSAQRVLLFLPLHVKLRKRFWMLHLVQSAEEWGRYLKLLAFFPDSSFTW